MRFATWGWAIALAIGTAGMPAFGPAQAQSQPDDYRAVRPRAPARITVTPSRRLVRECVGWYAIEHRLAGTVVTPQKSCHWAYR
ncbi:MAG: hypothetical protein JNM23_08530 [Bradyrhizobiaceae bacterium]|nr:hypothetical protein [Bradyrhizobiaceae bacterium]